MSAVAIDGAPGPAAAALAAAAPARRKFKASDLPLNRETRQAIESLAHSFKKKGGYDAIRKQVWDKFEASVSLTFRSLVFLPSNSSFVTKIAWAGL
jgi:hypothetical protein